MHFWNHPDIFFFTVMCLFWYPSFGSFASMQKLDLKKLFSESTCNIRYLEVQNYSANCTEMAAANEICSKNLTVAYLNVPPYIMSEDNKIEGILYGMFSLMFALTELIHFSDT